MAKRFAGILDESSRCLHVAPDHIRRVSSQLVVVLMATNMNNDDARECPATGTRATSHRISEDARSEPICYEHIFGAPTDSALSNFERSLRQDAELVDFPHEVCSLKTPFRREIPFCNVAGTGLADVASWQLCLSKC